MMNKVKEINVYENYELEDSKFRIKVNKEFELWEKGVRVLLLCIYVIVDFLIVVVVDDAVVHLCDRWFSHCCCC